MGVIKVKVWACLNGLRGEASTIIEFEKEDWEEMNNFKKYAGRWRFVYITKMPSDMLLRAFCHNTKMLTSTGGFAISALARAIIRATIGSIFSSFVRLAG